MYNKKDYLKKKKWMIFFLKERQPKKTIISKHSATIHQTFSIGERSGECAAWAKAEHFLCQGRFEQYAKREILH